MALIHLVRHGQASFGARDYDQLSPLGHRQATMLGHWLAQTRIVPDRLIQGSLTRHRQTAERCLAAWMPPTTPPLTPFEDAAFDEFDHRDILVKAHPEFVDPGYLETFLARQSDGRRMFQKVFADSVARWMSGGSGETPGTEPYKESWGAFRDRCVAGLIRAAASEGDVWVFTSGGPIAVALGHVLGLSDDRVLDLNWSILNASVTTLRQAKGRLLLHQFNTIAHLQTAPDDGLVTYR